MAKVNAKQYAAIYAAQYSMDDIVDKIEQSTKQVVYWKDQVAYWKGVNKEKHAMAIVSMNMHVRDIAIYCEALAII